MSRSEHTANRILRESMTASAHAHKVARAHQVARDWQRLRQRRKARERIAAILILTVVPAVLAWAFIAATN